MATGTSDDSPLARPRPAWLRTTTGLARRAASTFIGHQRVDEKRLDAIERRLASIDDQLRELREVAGTQVDVENQTTELFGRLLRAVSDRIEDIEGRVGRHS